MPVESAPVLPEVRRVSPGDTLLLCRCGRSPRLPDCPPACSLGVRLVPVREQLLVLCRCGGSQRLPYCDGTHNPPVAGIGRRWRRFWRGDE